LKLGSCGANALLVLQNISSALSSRAVVVLGPSAGIDTSVLELPGILELSSVSGAIYRCGEIDEEQGRVRMEAYWTLTFTIYSWSLSLASLWHAYKMRASNGIPSWHAL
jgi:hypothetical protein